VEATGILSTQVQEAFADGVTSLAFQPVVRLSDGEVVYYESLVRVTTADGVQLLPAELLPVVQRLGLMPRLTRLVLDLALQALADNPGTAVSVNLSGSDIADEQLLADVVAALTAAGLDSGRMVFEIAEDVLLADLIDGRRWIDDLSALGCRFVVDDFGTGLGVFDLLRIPGIEQMKLSQAVTGALANSHESRQFVRSVRELIESHGKTAVVAFVQNSAMLADAVEAGFQFAQGHEMQEPEADLGALSARLTHITRL